MIRNFSRCLRFTPRIRHFSVAPIRFNLDQTKNELVSSLRAEQKLELETAEEAKDAVKDIFSFVEKNKFELKTKDGNELVELTKKVSDQETLRVFFSISDVVNSDALLDDEPLHETAEGIEEEDLATPIRVNIVVEKPNGALGIEGVVNDDLVLVESMIPYASAKLAVEESAEADYTRRLAYQGPPFGVLDPSVQSAVQNYLESRGIDGDFALFVQEFASFRENKEYSNWLGKIADILE